MSEAVWQDVECGAYRADLPLWRGLVRETAGDGSCDLLDLGAGTGRVSLALAGPRCRVTALDVDPELVAVLRQRAAARDLSVDAQVGDAREFDLRRRFDLVLAPMQLVQLMTSGTERRALLACAARHLRRGGRLAVALLDLELDEEWSVEPGHEPLPDMLDLDGWVYSSHPVAVRRTGGKAIELDRLRRAASPDGELVESVSRIRLADVSPALLEREARDAGLVAESRRTVSATEDHVGSVVCILERTA
jgi:SAM-dependent methyltransferase